MGLLHESHLETNNNFVFHIKLTAEKKMADNTIPFEKKISFFIFIG